MCQEANGHWTLVGITSWGYGCQSTSVFTKVSRFTDFIDAVIHGGKESYYSVIKIKYWTRKLKSCTYLIKIKYFSKLVYNVSALPNTPRDFFINLTAYFIHLFGIQRNRLLWIRYDFFCQKFEM